MSLSAVKKGKSIKGTRHFIKKTVQFWVLVFVLTGALVSCRTGVKNKKLEPLNSERQLAPLGDNPVLAHPVTRIMGVWQLDTQLADRFGSEEVGSPSHAKIRITPNYLSGDAPFSIWLQGIRPEWVGIEQLPQYIKKLPFENFTFDVSAISTQKIEIAKEFVLSEGGWLSDRSDEIAIGKLNIGITADLTATHFSFPSRIEVTLRFTNPGGGNKTVVLFFKRVSEAEENPIAGLKASLDRFDEEIEYSKANRDWFFENKQCPALDPGFEFGEYWTFDLEQALDDGDLKCADEFMKKFIKSGGDPKEIAGFFLRVLSELGSSGPAGSSGQNNFDTLEWLIRWVRQSAGTSFSDRTVFKDDRFQTDGLGGEGYRLWGRFGSARIRGSGASEIIEQSLLSDSAGSRPWLHFDQYTKADLQLGIVTALRWENSDAHHISYWATQPFFVMRETPFPHVIDILVDDLLKSEAAPQNDNVECEFGGVFVNGSPGHYLDIKRLRKAAPRTRFAFDEGWDSDIYCISPTRIYYEMFDENILNDNTQMQDYKMNALLDLGLVPNPMDAYFPKVIEFIANLEGLKKETLRRLLLSNADLRTSATIALFRYHSDKKIENNKKRIIEIEDESKNNSRYAFQTSLHYLTARDRLVAGTQRIRTDFESILKEVGTSP